MLKCKMVVDGFGTKRYYYDNKYHRINGPAIEYLNGSKYWFKYGFLHRENGPAIERWVVANGYKIDIIEWWFNGKRHRVNGPALEYGNRKEWWKNGIMIKDG